MRAASNSPQQQQCRVVNRNEFSPKGFRWLSLQRIEWQGPDGRSRFWESVERQTTVKDEHNVEGADAVAVVARATEKAGNQSSILIIKQFRPPVGRHILELPAGLIDPGETPSQAACRELKEECGYTATVSSISPLVYNDPGITNANMMLAVVDVDLDSPDNQNVEPKLHEGEFIESFWAPYGSQLLEWLLRKKQEEGVEVDARLLMMAMGYHQACIDIDTEMRDPTDNLVEPGKAAALESTTTNEHIDKDRKVENGASQDGEDFAMVERRVSSRSNVNLMQLQVRRAIGPREIVAWGVAAVMTLASIMR